MKSCVSSWHVKWLQADMTDIDIRIVGHAGRITLNRPKALNALTYSMISQIEDALDAWASDPAVALIVLDAAGEKAFCAGGDIADLYRTGMDGDFEFGQKFWADEYRLNAKIFAYAKPIVSFLQGFTMGGGVGVGCHGSHRIVGDTSRIAMPEVGIGLVPDVGGSLMLALAPGRVGEYLGTTAYRMDAGDAIFAGFADTYIPESDWPDLIATLETTGDTTQIEAMAQPAPLAKLKASEADINRFFAGETLGDIYTLLDQSEDEFANETLKTLKRNSPLAMASAVEILHRLRGVAMSIEKTLDLEFRFTSRAMEFGDFLEGIRAAIIDKDRAPRWKHDINAVPTTDVAKMLMPQRQIKLDLTKREAAQ